MLRRSLPYVQELRRHYTSWAVSSCYEESLYAYDYVDTNARGTANTIYIRDRTLAGTCYPDIFDVPGAWSTAHLQGNGSTLRQAEAGYYESYQAGGVHGFWFFWEGQVGNTVYGNLQDGPCCQSSGMSDPFKVTNKKGTTQWVFYYQIGSGTFTQFGPSNSCQCLDLGFSSGTPNDDVPLVVELRAAS